MPCVGKLHLKLEIVIDGRKRDFIYSVCRKTSKAESNLDTSQGWKNFQVVVTSVSLPILSVLLCAHWKKLLLMAVGYGIFFLQPTIEGIGRLDASALHFLRANFLQLRYPYL